MRTNYVLIDYENVQPKSLSRLSGHPFTVKVFLGAHQKHVPVELAKTLQSLGANADYVLMSGSGRNALDFHVAFYLGELVATDPGGSFNLISKDKGFEPLIKHLKARGIAAQRFADVGEVPLPAASAPKGLNDRVAAVIDNFAKRGNTLPKRDKTLSSTIDGLFSRTLRQDEVDDVVAALQKRGVLVVKNGKVSYSL